MQRGLSPAVEPTLAKRNGIHVGPKAVRNVLAGENADMDTQEWKEDEGEEGVEIAGQKAAHEASKDARDEHQRTHIPFRNCCARCVRGRCKGATHKKGTRPSRE